jgi:prepilin-type N-terminal cleavage/methylation domain-containing protein
MKKINRFGGFTLIELLVVIAIIGILSSVVLVSLNSARIRARDEAVRSNLNTVRSEIELYYINNNEGYGTPASAGTAVCSDQPFSEGVIPEALDSAEENGGTEDTLCAVGPSGDSWAVSVPLASSGSWCVSSVGVSGFGAASGGGSEPATCI